MKYYKRVQILWNMVKSSSNLQDYNESFNHYGPLWLKQMVINKNNFRIHFL